MNIKSKLISYSLSISLLSLVVSNGLLYFSEKENATREIFNHLESVASVQRARISGLYQQNLERLRLVASRTQLRISLDKFNQTADIKHQRKMNHIIADALMSIDDFKVVLIADLDGTIVASTDKSRLGKSIADKDVFISGKIKNRVDFFEYDQKNNLATQFSGPLYLKEKLLGVLIIESAIDTMMSSLTDYTGLGKTGETTLARRNDQGDAVFILPTRFNKNAALTLSISSQDINKPLIHAVNGDEMFFESSVDYRGHTVLSVTRYIEGANWGLAVKIDKLEAFSHLTKTRDRVIITLLVCCLFIIIASIYFAKQITRPITQLTNTAKKIIEGHLDVRANESSHDEMGLLGTTFNLMTLSLHNEQDKLKNSQSRIKLLLDSTAEAIYGVDTNGLCSFVNQSCLNMLGYDNEAELLGENMHDLIHYKLQEGTNNSLGTGQKTTAFDNQKEIHVDNSVLSRKDGSCFDAEYWSHPIFEDNTCVGAVVTFMDITDKKQAEETIRRTQKMNALDKLTGGIAHDYNNMLGVIKGYAELIEMSLDGQPQLENYVRQICQASDRASTLTQKLLAFSSKKSSVTTVLNFKEFLQDEKDLLEKTLTARIDLTYDLEDGLWPIDVDVGDLEDSIINMCINSMHAMEQGGKLTLKASNKHLNDIDCKKLHLQVGDYVLLSISDSGSGMDALTREKIFDPFYTTKGEKGTGLGLSQVYGFIKRCKGAVNVFSEVGLGSVFTLYFPRSYTDKIDLQENSKPNSNLQGTETLLVVDDETALVDMAQTMLSEKGYNVLEAYDGEQALSVLKSKNVDLVITDIIMPNMDGYQLAIQMRKQYPHIKLQIVSGFAGDHHDELVDENLRQNILQKPYTSNALLSKVRGLLDET